MWRASLVHKYLAQYLVKNNGHSKAAAGAEYSPADYSRNEMEYARLYIDIKFEQFFHGNFGARVNLFKKAHIFYYEARLTANPVYVQPNFNLVPISWKFFL